ncbi:putative leucine-rich PPR motif-containing protein, mitochondrial [Ditylenchus destructor]|uniref:Leucine-rich PPR motif-containing protein, mitochondrial n=1 Tax=Ditylenchus destructor TaxID=166010 RepID=A0AAD4NGP4_9BILA|nr:putative leucine-rich PPR motif-containing protein, mitochondrial [Ditylenchus destructor]
MMLRVVGKFEFLRIQSNEVLGVRKITLGLTKYSAPSPSASLDEKTTKEIPNAAIGSKYSEKTTGQRHQRQFGAGANGIRKTNQYHQPRGKHWSNFGRTQNSYGRSWNGQKSNLNDLQPIIDRIRNERKHAGADYEVILNKVHQTTRLPDNIVYYLILAGGQIKGHPMPEVRNQYLFRLMNKIKHEGHQIGILSMNALLEVMIDNNEEVDVIDFLQVVERKGLDLNVKTYTELARAYAIQGNGNAILSILSHLKEEQQTNQLSQDAPSAENGYAQQNGQVENVIQPVLNYLAYAEALSGQHENVYAIAKSAAQQFDLNAKRIYLHAASGFAKKGDIKEVESIMQRTPVRPTEGHVLKMICEIYLTLLHHTYDALEIMRPFLHLDHNGKLSEKMHMKQYLRDVVKLVNNGKLTEMEQALQLIPDNSKRFFELHQFPARTMLDYGLKMLDSGKPDELQKIVDAFKRPMPNKNTDDFFWFFIEEFFRRTGKPINVNEAWPLYLSLTEDNNSATSTRRFHRNTTTKLLHLAINETFPNKSSDSKTGSETRVSTCDKILQTVEECDSPATRQALRRTMLNEIIIGWPDSERNNKKMNFSYLVG